MEAELELTAQERTNREQAVTDYIKLALVWRNSFMRWYVFYYILGTLLLIFSAVAASARQLGLPEQWASMCSLIVVILTGSLGLFKPDDHASRHRQAWSLLHVQLSRFLYDQTYTLNDVIRAYEQGEAIIHQAAAAPQPASGSESQRTRPQS